MELRDAARQLYGVDPSSFMAERSRLAAEARSAGEKDLAKRLTGLRKPTVAAWVVNAAVRDRPDLLDDIRRLGTELRGDHDDVELRELGTERRRLIARAAREWAAAAGERGTAVSEAVQRDLESTVQAALIDAGAAVALDSGMLVRPLSANGLDAIDVSDAVALPEIADEAREAQGAPDAEVIEFRPRSRSGTSTAKETDRARASNDRAASDRAALDRAAGRLAAAERELEEARSELADLRDRLHELDGERGRLETEIDDLTEQLEGAREDLARVDRERGELRRRRTHGERAVTDAERRVNRLTPE
ncbi:hypothetical protein ACFJGV_05030 [Cnuibacter sp. UC19_7]|uniref:hypothetical protein n=1 Tax=Cnuibacter sp. UC19_7 TaxID=3350166 RepID=UPI00366B3CD1